MRTRLRLITRVALFSALIYVLSWATLSLPNISLLFFVVFTAGYLWGIGPGTLVGIFGMGLWTFFNPYGPAPFPIMVAQILGAAISGPVGAYFRITEKSSHKRWLIVTRLSLAGIICSGCFMVLTTVVDAWIFQPFWERLIVGLSWSAPALLSNAIIFPLLFNAASYLYSREGLRL